MGTTPAAADSAPVNATAPILSVRDLRVTFAIHGGALRAVDGISFDLLPGRITGLVGESGSGKTMAALSLMGLVPPPGRVDGGSIVLDGQEVVGLDEDALDRLRGERIGMIFQEPMTALNPVFTVGEQVAEMLRVHRGAGRRAAWDGAVAMLERVGIPDPARRAAAFPHQLSGGMRQRAMIAMALVCEPAVLIADEPTTALDVTIQAQILDLLLEMQEAHGLAVLFISHDLGVVSEIADDVLVMYAGRIAEQAAADTLFAAPRHPYTRGLLETLPDAAVPGARLPAIAGTVPDPTALPPGCRFSDRCPWADDGCRRDEPPLAELAPGHRAACFKAEPA